MGTTSGRFSFFPHKGQTFLRFCFIIYYFICFLTLISWSCEIVLGHSLTEWVFSNFSCPTVLRAGATQEAIKAIGISSALIVLVINSADKQVFGLPYTEIIQERYPYYWTCSAVHVIFTLGGIVSGAAGASESTLLSLVIILFGLYIQWCVLYNLILNHYTREQIADTILAERIQSAPPILQTYEILKQLTSDIAQSSQASRLLWRRFANTFIIFSIKSSPTIRISQLADIWAILLRNKAESSKALLIGQVLSECIYTEEISTSSRKQALVSICAGLLVYLIQNSSDEGELQYTEEKLSMIAIEIRRFIYQIPTSAALEGLELIDYTLRCLSTLFTTIIWITYFRSGLKLNDDILSISVFATERACYRCVFETAQVLFPVVNDCAENKLNEIVEKAFQLTIQKAKMRRSDAEK